MATSVQSIHTLPSHLPPKTTRVSSPAGAFTESFQDAGRDAENPLSLSTSLQSIDIRDPKTAVVEVEGPVTNQVVADVVAKAVLGESPSEPIADVVMLQACRADDETPILSGSDEVAKKDPERVPGPITREDTSANDVPIAVTCLTVGDARALRCNFLSSSFLDASIDSGLRVPVTATTQKQSELPEPGNPVPQTSKLIFQLALERTPELPPANGGRSIPAKAGDPQVQRAGQAVELPSVAAEDPPPIKLSIPAEIEKTPPKPTEARDGQSRLAPTAHSRETPEVLAEGLTVIQSSAAGQGHKPDTASTAPSARTVTSQLAEPFVPLSPLVRTPAILQKMDIVLRGTDQIVRLDIRQSMGSVKISVHSDDTALALQLRDSLPELLNRLDDRGLQARVTSVGAQSQLPPPTRTESGSTAGKESGGWSGDTAREQHREHRERNPQRAWRAANWKLDEE